MKNETPSPRETAITSSENAVFKILRDTLASKGIKKHEMFLVFGERAVHDTLKLNSSLVRDIIICQGSADDLGSPIRAFLSSTRKLAPAAVTLSLSRPLFDELDLFGTKAPILALQTPLIPDADLNQAPVGLEILCALSDPSNVGALLRSAAAFGASRVILLRESASPFHPKAVRAASAATLATPFARGPSIKEVANINFGQMVALDMRGALLSEYKWPENIRLLLGEEGLGLPDNAPHESDQRERQPENHSKIHTGIRSEIQLIAIPMAKNVESLNATVAASIALYSYRAQNGS